MKRWKCDTSASDCTSVLRKRDNAISTDNVSRDNKTTDLNRDDDDGRDNESKLVRVNNPTKIIHEESSVVNDGNEKSANRRYRSSVFVLVSLIAAVTIVLIVVRGLIDPTQRGRLSNDDNGGRLVPPDPEISQPASWSELRIFKRGAICTDGTPCAQIGKSMLDRDGSTMDAALAAMICNGLVNMQSMGIGGGFYMSVYERSTGRSFSLDAREVAPINSAYDMYANKSKTATSIGPLAIAVPGELAGYWEAHRRFGKLSWDELFRPSIELCNNGFIMTKHLYDALSINPSAIHEDPTLRKLFVDPATNSFRRAGSLIRPTKICETLKLIAHGNASILYNGTLGKKLIEDLKKRGSIMTMKDLNDYRVKWSDPIETDLLDGNKLITTGLPSSGSLLAFILNVIKNYRFTTENLNDFNNTIVTYHRITEAYKYAYAMRTRLADDDFVDVTEIIEKLLSNEYARSIKDKISDDRTWNDPRHYGARNPGPENHGTAHISLLAPNGDAISVTSSVNFYFGCGIVSESTGILLNNAMDDFGVPSMPNYFGLPPEKNNYIEPGKRPYSSMAPSIIVGSNGDVRMVIGAAGGPKITTAISYVIARHLWMNNTIKEAVDAARIHHQIFPMEFSYEYGVPRPIIDGLNRIGHKTSRYRDRGSIVCAIVQSNGTVFATADYRKIGDICGID